MRLKTRKGMTLVEIIIVLVLSVLIIAGALVFANFVMVRSTSSINEVDCIAELDAWEDELYNVIHQFDEDGNMYIILEDTSGTAERATNVLYIADEDNTDLAYINTIEELKDCDYITACTFTYSGKLLLASTEYLYNGVSYTQVFAFAVQAATIIG